MQTIFACLSQQHDPRLLLLAVLVCTVGVYSASALAAHAGHCSGRPRLYWTALSVVAAGCTAWATHMVGMLAFDPGMGSGFDPFLTTLSLLAAIAGIAAGMGLAVGSRNRLRRFAGGLILGAGIASLHYLGQVSLVFTGHVVWDGTIVVSSIALSELMFGASMMLFGERSRLVRQSAAPLMLAAISVLHFGGMAAATLVFDPRHSLPATALSPAVVAPIVAGVSLGLLGLAVLGFRLKLAALAAARRDRERLRELAGFALEGLAICDGDVVVSANQSLEDIAGANAGGLTGRGLGTLLPGIDLAALPEREERDAELMSMVGQFIPVRVLRREVMLGTKRQSVVAVRDQRERLRTEAEIRALAYSDSLTGLPNRARFGELVAAHSAVCRTREACFAVHLIDLDRFKLVNDTFGHGAGDHLLRLVADRLRSVASDVHIAGRLGGDEFAVVQTGVAAAEEAAALAQQIIALMAKPFAVHGQTVHVGASIGVVIAPGHGGTPDMLMRNADLALYHAKAEGRNRFCLFEEGFEKRTRDRRQIESDLRLALERDEFEVHYQPLVDTRTRAITGAEALVRWRHPVRGLVSPAEFIPIAEETGLIVQLGRWVLQTACVEASSWPDHVRLAVNLSPAQFRDPKLVEAVFETLAAATLPPRRLELEITEGVLLGEEERTLSTLARLREAGVGLSLDDFGTGYSSLSYLRRFPFSKLKIDRSFIRHLPGDVESAAIVRAIVALARALGMSTTVEGIETSDQLAFAVSEQCGQAQGYLLGRPVVGSEFAVLLKEGLAAA